MGVVAMGGSCNHHLSNSKLLTTAADNRDNSYVSLSLLSLLIWVFRPTIGSIQCHTGVSFVCKLLVDLY